MENFGPGINSFIFDCILSIIQCRRSTYSCVPSVFRHCLKKEINGKKKTFSSFLSTCVTVEARMSSRRQVRSELNFIVQQHNKNLEASTSTVPGSMSVT